MCTLRILPYLLHNSTLKESKNGDVVSVNGMWRHLSNNVVLVPQQVDTVCAAWRVLIPVSVLFLGSVSYWERKYTPYW